MYVNGTREPKCIGAGLAFFGSRPVLLPVGTVAVDEALQPLTLE